VEITQEMVEIARQVELPQYLDSLGIHRSKQYTGGMFYFSPFRGEQEASLHVSKINGLWLWFDHGSSERRGGDAISFVMHYRGCSFQEAVLELCEYCGIGSTVISTRKTTEHKKKKKGLIKSVRTIRTIEKALTARKMYAEMLRNDILIRKYFKERNLRYRQQYGCKIYIEKDIKYIAFPLPNIHSIRGIELREICRPEKELLKKKRKTYGLKTIWFQKRGSILLLTESILDALAGEQLLGEDLSLCALNGVTQVMQVKELLKHFRPEQILLCLDNDEPGRKAAEKAIEIFRQEVISYEVLQVSEKDLYREYTKYLKGGISYASGIKHRVK